MPWNIHLKVCTEKKFNYIFYTEIFMSFIFTLQNYIQQNVQEQQQEDEEQL